MSGGAARGRLPGEPSAKRGVHSIWRLVVAIGATALAAAACPPARQTRPTLAALAREAARAGNLRLVGVERLEMPAGAGGGAGDPAGREASGTVEIRRLGERFLCWRKEPAGVERATLWDGHAYYHVDHVRHVLLGRRSSRRPTGLALAADLGYAALAADPGVVPALSAAAGLAPAPPPPEYGGEAGPLEWFAVPVSASPSPASRPASEFWRLGPGEGLSLGLERPGGQVRAGFGAYRVAGDDGESAIVRQSLVLTAVRAGAVRPEDLRLPAWAGAAQWHDEETRRQIEAPRAVIAPR
jgi:hypothetical protein